MSDSASYKTPNLLLKRLCWRSLKFYLWLILQKNLIFLFWEKFRKALVNKTVRSVTIFSKWKYQVRETVRWMSAWKFYEKVRWSLKLILAYVVWHTITGVSFWMVIWEGKRNVSRNSDQDRDTVPCNLVIVIIKGRIHCEIFLSKHFVNFTVYLYIKFQLNFFLRFHETFQWKKFLAFKS